MLAGRVACAAAPRRRRSKAPPAAGGAATTSAVPITGAVAEPTRRLTVAPATVPLPVTRKSATFHFAVAIVTVSPVGLYGPALADSAPNPLAFFAATVKEYSLPAVSPVIVTDLPAAGVGAPTGVAPS